MFGLKESEFYLIIDILKIYSKEIDWVKIFGSRARGDFNMGKRTLFYWSKLYSEQLKEGEDKSGVILEDDLEIHFLELTKLSGFDKNDPLTGWGMFLKQPASDIVEEAEETVIEIKKAKEELYKISADEDERELYRIREKAYLDEISALAEAEAKGQPKTCWQKG
ncbi:MAG: PD-(D/E)XK nuclease family transposase [Fusobacteriaceae bacterium]